MPVDLICKKVSQDTENCTKTEVTPQDDPVITCRRCGSLVTRPDLRISVGGSFSHTFANPHGQVFEIGCFSGAEGCVKTSGSSNDFSWFKDHVWSIGLCRSCQTQLGWVFLPIRKGQRFFGLILDALTFP